MKNVRTAITAGAVAVLALGSAVALPSMARAAREDCHDSYVCLWRDPNYTGGVKTMTSNQSTPKLINLYDFNDVMTSWANDSATRDARWFYEYDGKGKSGCMNTHSFNPNVGWGTSDYQSSVVIYTDDRAC